MMIDERDGHTDMRSISDRLETVRAQIEDRFVDGGAALMAAHENVASLLDALSGVAGALDEERCSDSATKLSAAIDGLGAMAATEGAARKRLSETLGAAQAITPLINDMQGQLRYLSICAIETRVAGAGVPEFAGFADDVATYVGNAADQVKIFSGRLGALHSQLAAAGLDRAGASVAASVPAVSARLDAAGNAIRQHRHDLRRLAGRAETVARSVQGKVGTVLSALQIGDMTRQRIEHVQTGIALLSEALASLPEAERPAAAAIGRHLLVAQTAALAEDFRKGTRDIVTNIEGLARDAEAVLALTRCGEASDSGSSLKAIEEAVGLARHLVRGIEDTVRKAGEIHASTIAVANDLLSNMGSIGNLRSVRDDIRCLAINAYLRSNRLGVRGRAVGVIAAEMNTYAARLGVAAEGILSRLAAMHELARAADGAPSGERRDIVAELDMAADALATAQAQTLRHMTDIVDGGGAVSRRVSAIAADVDFRKGLGDALDSCCALFRTAADAALPAVPPAGLEGFSMQLYRVYTMASERDVHRSILPLGIETACNSEENIAASVSNDMFDDVLF